MTSKNSVNLENKADSNPKYAERSYFEEHHSSVSIICPLVEQENQVCRMQLFWRASLQYKHHMPTSWTRKPISVNLKQRL